MNELSINIFLDNHDVTVLTLFAQQENSLFEVKDAGEFGESPYQLKEGCRYDFELDKYEYYIADNQILTNSQSRQKVTRGYIQTGIFVGTCQIEILERESGQRVGNLKFEVCSSKASYRDDYRKMLEDITVYCTELLMSQNSPVIQKFEVDITKNPRAEYQRFAFVRSLVDSETFADALHQIQLSPVKKWIETDEERNICNVKRLGHQALRQIVCSVNRINIPEKHYLKGTFDSLPRKISVASKRETVDISENRFVKYVLQSFLVFCSSIQRYPDASERLKKEADLTSEKLIMYLSYPLFRNISNINILPLNSPVLQKKEGYREVYQKWLMFDMAARLTWQGGDDVYEAGKKNVAILYEYWLFFKLLDILSKKFQISPKSKKELIEFKDGVLNLALKQGKVIMLGGVYETASRKLNIQFSYNRVFGYTKDYKTAGSWSRSFRPDYTLSIWPGDVTSVQAEREELITHIHFDAKYRIDRLFLSGDENISNEKDSNELSDLKLEEESGTYKRADLLKMHTYKDAIKRTGGAYVLYPGTENHIKFGFHEIIPGLGAFAISPKNENLCLGKFISFLDDVIENFLDRTSQRENLAYHTYSILQQKSTNLYESLPEPYGINRDLLPNKTFVLIGYYKNEEHLKWILKSNLYNTRTGTGNGSLKLNTQFTSARYLLLHGSLGQYFIKMNTVGPRILSKQDLINKEYPGIPQGEYYIVFALEKEKTEYEFTNMRWNLSEITNHKGHQRGVPDTILLSDLMKHRIKD